MTENKQLKNVILWLTSQEIIENQEDLAVKLGYNPSSLSQIVTGKKPISDKFVVKLINFCDKINYSYLFGEGEMLKSNEKRVIDYNNLGVEVKNRLLEIAVYMNLSISGFEAACGLKRGYINNMSENSSIGSDQLTKIIDSFSYLNLEWILTGNGDMIKEGIDKN